MGATGRVAHSWGQLAAPLVFFSSVRQLHLSRLVMCWCLDPAIAFPRLQMGSLDLDGCVQGLGVFVDVLLAASISTRVAASIPSATTTLVQASTRSATTHTLFPATSTPTMRPRTCACTPGGATRSGRRPSPRASTVWGESTNYSVIGSEATFGVKSPEGTIPINHITISNPDSAWNLDGNESKTLLARAPTCSRLLSRK